VNDARVVLDGIANTAIAALANLAAGNQFSGYPLTHGVDTDAQPSAHHSRPSPGNALVENSGAFDVQEGGISHDNLTGVSSEDHHKRPTSTASASNQGSTQTYSDSGSGYQAKTVYLNVPTASQWIEVNWTFELDNTDTSATTTCELLSDGEYTVGSHDVDKALMYGNTDRVRLDFDPNTVGQGTVSWQYDATVYVGGVVRHSHSI
jgi:hypothetical protein